MTDNSEEIDRKLSLASERRSKTGMARLWPALQNSCDGIVATLRTESAFRQEMAFFIVMLPLGLWLGETYVEKVLLIAPLFLVLLTELLNTAVESAIDRWGADYNDFAKVAKDAGSAAVFFSLLLVVFTWALLLVVPALT
ncbi:MAG: diacylglycerol kinase [Gammaproteobacteria bacterium]|nr:diacylglycerol kinase [Gammaproteobacteria bacterium]